MKGYLILLLIVLFQYANTTAGDCENVELPTGVNDCDGKDLTDADVTKQCCFVSFKTSGKYYAMCFGVPKPDTKKWKEEYDELKDMYSHVEVECLSSSSIKVSFIALLGFLAMLV